MNRPNLERLQALARRDDWHTDLVGSDVREVIAYALRLESAITPTKAEADVLAERAKQRTKWGDEHDDDHEDGVLALAAGYLAGPNGILHPDPDFDEDAWCAPEWVRDIADKVRKDRRRELVIAAALLVAEIERLDRAGGE